MNIVDRLNIKKSIGILILFAFGIQTVLISNGLLGVSILTFKKLCTCDHSGTSSVHSGHNPEDSHFSRTSLRVQGEVVQNSKSSTNSKIESAQEILGSSKVSSDFMPESNEICHSTSSTSIDHNMDEPSNPHFCPHETSKKNVESSSLALNTLLAGEDIVKYYSPELTLSFSFIFPTYPTMHGFGNPPYKPPRC